MFIFFIINNIIVNIVQVLAVGDWLPRSVLGRCQALCAYIRMLYVALLLVFGNDITYDLIFCDQVCGLFFYFLFLP